MRKFLLAFLLTLATGCTNPPHRQQYPELTYAYLPPFKFNVAHINIVDQYQNSDAPQHVEKAFPQIPAQVLRRWATDRLVAAGNAGFANFTILRADAIDTPLPRTTGLAGAFTQDQSDRYDLTLEVSLEVNNPAFSRAGTATAKASASQTVAEDATLNEREAVWFQMTESTMKAINAELERQIRANLGALLLP